MSKQDLARWIREYLKVSNSTALKLTIRYLQGQKKDLVGYFIKIGLP
jgi:hypothetical protein